MGLPLLGGAVKLRVSLFRLATTLEITGLPGTPGATVSVNDWTAVPTELTAMKLIGQVPIDAAAGLPASTPLAGVKVTPAGSAPDWEIEGVGDPVAVTVNELADPTMKVAAFALVMAGRTPTVTVAVAGVPDPAALVPVTE